MSETQIETEELEDDFSDWIAVGGGNHTSGEELLANGYNQAQVDYLRSLRVQTCVIGMIINANPESSFGVHFDAHPLDIEGYANDIPGYLAEMLALG